MLNVEDCLCISKEKSVAKPGVHKSCIVTKTCIPENKDQVAKSYEWQIKRTKGTLSSRKDVSRKQTAVML